MILLSVLDMHKFKGRFKKTLYPNCISYLLIWKKKKIRSDFECVLKIQTTAQESINFLTFLSLLFTKQVANAQTTCLLELFICQVVESFGYCRTFYCCSLYFISKYFKGKRFSISGCALLLIVVLPKRKVVSLVHIINTFVVAVVLKVFYFYR